MLNELNLIAGGAATAFLSGLAGLGISRLAVSRARRESESVMREMSWVHQSTALARNLLVLETVGDEIESTPIDIAVRAKLTPAEMQEALRQLKASHLVDEPSGNLIRLTSTGRDVLAKHKLELEESVLSREHPNTSRRTREPEELDLAIEQAVAVLRAQHAH